MSLPKLGYIGLGIMGRPAAVNLLQAGYEVYIWARRPASVEPVAEAGGRACAGPRAVAEQAEVIFVNVSDTADVEQVVLGEDGIIQGARPDSVVVDMSTISPAATRAMAERLSEAGVQMLDAPVSGGEQGAIDGTLSIMVGGDAGAFERVRPMFEVMGRNIVHIGPSGAGQVTKACNQVVIAQTIAAVGEAFLLAKASGVDPARVRQALLGGFAGSKVLEAHGRRMLEDDYRPGFKARLHKKDMRIVMETAEALGIALPGAAVATQFLNTLVGQGGGELDSAAISTMQQKLSGVSLRED
jgi:2-hydroxy-3-oxopropionate reductase